MLARKNPPLKTKGDIYEQLCMKIYAFWYNIIRKVGIYSPAITLVRWSVFDFLDKLGQKFFSFSVVILKSIRMVLRLIVEVCSPAGGVRRIWRRRSLWQGCTGLGVFFWMFLIFTSMLQSIWCQGQPWLSWWSFRTWCCHPNPPLCRCLWGYLLLLRLSNAHP